MSRKFIAILTASVASLSIYGNTGAQTAEVPPMSWDPSSSPYETGGGESESVDYVLASLKDKTPEFEAGDVAGFVADALATCARIEILMRGAHGTTLNGEDGARWADAVRVTKKLGFANERMTLVDALVLYRATDLVMGKMGGSRMAIPLGEVIERYVGNKAGKPNEYESEWGRGALRRDGDVVLLNDPRLKAIILIVKGLTDEGFKRFQTSDVFRGMSRTMSQTKGITFVTKRKVGGKMYDGSDTDVVIRGSSKLINVATPVGGRVDGRAAGVVKPGAKILNDGSVGAISGHTKSTNSGPGIRPGRAGVVTQKPDDGPKGDEANRSRQTPPSQSTDKREPLKTNDPTRSRKG